MILAYKNYQINIIRDTDPINPFNDYDYIPFMAFQGTFYGQLTTYGKVPTIEELVNLIPDKKLKRGERIKTIKHLGITTKEFAIQKQKDRLDDRKVIMNLLMNKFPPCDQWHYMCKHFQTLSKLCSLADIPHYFGISYNFNQSDYALIIIFGSQNTTEDEFKNIFSLYSCFAWGDCYRIKSITDPDGNKIDLIHVTFYGSDFEANGLLHYAQEIINYHTIMKKLRKIEKMFSPSRN